MAALIVRVAETQRRQRKCEKPESILGIPANAHGAHAGFHGLQHVSGMFGGRFLVVHCPAYTFSYTTVNIEMEKNVCACVFRSADRRPRLGGRN